MPIFDYICEKCNFEFEAIAKFDEEVECPKCFTVSKRQAPKKPPSFKLTYNPQTDMVDWDGNTTRYYDEYKKMKAEGKKPRIPKLDGDG